MADLVYPGLQRANPAADEGPEQVIYSELLIHDVLLHHIVDGVDLDERLLRVVVLVELLIGRGQAECRKVDEVCSPDVLHVEEHPLLFAAGFQPKDSGEDRLLLGSN